MSDAFYRTMCVLGRPVFWSSSRPVAIGGEHVPRAGACLVAATHSSPYDIPLLMRHTRRLVDFVSITEVFRKPLLGRFYGSLNAFPLDRSRADPKTVRIILDRLQRGRCIGIFPEGGFRKGADSVVHSRRIRPGIGRIAHMANAPVVPCVIIGSAIYSKPTSWFPLRRTRYGIIYGAPISSTLDPQQIESTLIEAYVALHAQLTRAMSLS